MTRISRRSLLAGLAGLPLGAFTISCSGDGPVELPDATDVVRSDGAVVEPAKVAPPTPTPEPPFIVPAGEERLKLLEGTPYASDVYVFGTGQPGAILMAVGGVHGNEPGGWLAAERVAARIRPSNGALLVLPRANQVAIPLFERTTDALGDLNRLYPGNPEGLPMERMASAIVDTLKRYHVDIVVDMHESWAFYKDRPQNGTAFLGQTVATYPSEPGVSLARHTVESVNARILGPQEEFFFREFPNRALPGPTSTAPFDTSGNPQAAVSGGSRSSLGLLQWVPGITAILVEMGQQQTLERRIALHVEVFQQVMREVGQGA